MARYTTTQEISFREQRESRAVSSNGTLTVSLWNGTNYDVIDTITDDAVIYFTKGLRLKFEISVGGDFYIEEGEQQ